MELTIDMPGDAQYTGMSAGGIADPSQSGLASSGTFELIGGEFPITSTGIACAGGSACKVSVRAYLGGSSSNAARAAVAFVIGSGGPSAKVLRGALIFGS